MDTLINKVVAFGMVMIHKPFLRCPQIDTLLRTLQVEENIGTYFFKSGVGHNVTVNGQRRRAMIIDFFVPGKEEVDVKDLWY